MSVPKRVRFSSNIAKPVSHPHSLNCPAVSLTLASFHEPNVQFTLMEKCGVWSVSLVLMYFRSLSRCLATYHSSYLTELTKPRRSGTVRGKIPARKVKYLFLAGARFSEENVENVPGGGCPVLPKYTNSCQSVQIHCLNVLKWANSLAWADKNQNFTHRDSFGGGKLEFRTRGFSPRPAFTRCHAN